MNNDNIFNTNNITFLKEKKGEKYLSEFLNKGIVQIKTAIEHIREDEDKKDIEQIKFKLHKLKGSTSLFGAKNVSEYCAKVQKNPESEINIADTLEDKFNLVLIELKNLEYIK